MSEIASPFLMRQPNKTELRLMDSALGLFAEKGFESTSVREIIERAGVTRPVLYYYFASKEGLFSRLIKSRIQNNAQQIDTICSEIEGCAEQLRAIARYAFEQAETEPAVVRLTLQLFFSPPGQGPDIDKKGLWEDRFDRIENVIRKGMDSGELKQGDSKEVAMAFCAMLDMQVLTRWGSGQEPLTLEFADRLVNLFLEGAAA
ncbi:MAG: TetR/AcrR family transcriptional regulator [Candidatus Hydrogenedentota bacterium]